MKAYSSFVTTFRNSKMSGKIAIGCSALLFLCLCVSVPVGLLSNSTPTQESTVQNILTPIYETSQSIAIDSLTQTASAVSPEPTSTLEPTATLEPTSTPLPVLPTATLEPAVALPANAVSCVPTGSTREAGTVFSIVDGDTIDVAIGDQTFRVRYIGIDTPESGDNLYWQATGENQNLVFGKEIILIKDVSETDRYDRLLRYIFVGDTFVNYELVRRGFAQASTYPPDVACADYFAQAQSQAQAEIVGLWVPAPTAISLPPILPSIPPNSGSGSTGNCSPAYPSVCIPPPPPDLNCKDVPFKRFRVLPPDPHNFDRDGDGIGCES